jgi:hypothetical protein
MGRSSQRSLTYSLDVGRVVDQFYFIDTGQTGLDPLPAIIGAERFKGFLNS